MTQLILYNVYIMITNYISCDMNRALSKNAEKCYDEIKTTYCIYNIKYRLHNRFYYSGGWLHSMVMIKVGKMLMRNYARKKNLGHIGGIVSLQIHQYHHGSFTTC